MSLIQKQAILTQLDNTIASLNLSTQDTQALLAYLKTAINAESDTDISTELATRIESIGITAGLEEIVLLALAANEISNNRILTVPNLATLQGFTNISTGTIYFVESTGISYIRKSNGTWVSIGASATGNAPNLYSWGFNPSGSLGDSTALAKSTPIYVSGIFSDWIGVSAGNSHSLGLRANGTIWAWGANTGGRLGDNSVVSKSSPVSVVGGIADWVQVSAGQLHSLGLRANGLLYAWGTNSSVQLGTGNTTSALSPVLVTGGINNWTSASAGDIHSLGIRATGQLYAWGNNGSGRLGDGTTAAKSSPTLVAGGISDWTSASAGYVHSLGIRATGQLYAWGAGTQGVLGDGTTAAKSTPTLVAGGITDWVTASTNGGHSVALRSNGTAWSWGFNTDGRLGDGTTANKSSPVLVAGGFTDWIAVSGGGFFSLGIRANGTAWGLGGQGTPLGNGTTTSSTSPVSVAGGFTDWIHVSAGNQHSLGIRS